MVNFFFSFGTSGSISTSSDLKNQSRVPVSQQNVRIPQFKILQRPKKCKHVLGNMLISIRISRYKIKSNLYRKIRSKMSPFRKKSLQFIGHLRYNSEVTTCTLSFFPLANPHTTGRPCESQPGPIAILQSAGFPSHR